MADETKKDASAGNLEKEKVTAPVPNQPSEDETDSDDTTHTGRQKKYDGGAIPRSNR